MREWERCNQVIEEFEKAMDTPQRVDGTLYTGVDLGTAFVVLAVVDEEGIPVAGAYEFADVVRDGMVVDYIGAVDIVRRLKDRLEEQLGTELLYAGAAIPPNMDRIDGGAVRNVVESAGFELIHCTDEPTAANVLLKMQDGAVVDIGGGTTGIAVIQNGTVVHTTDEATGGTHVSLVIAGAKNMSFREAEEYKRQTKNHRELLPVVGPVIDKIGSIVRQGIEGYEIGQILLVGGTCCLTGLEERLQRTVDCPVYKPANPMFVTPLGIALGAAEKGGSHGSVRH